MIRICFSGFENGFPVVPLAFACGVGTNHTYIHRENAIRVLTARAPALWSSSTIEEADAVVYPHEYADNPTTREVAREANAHGLPCVFFEHSDDENPAMPPYGLVWRTALDSSRGREREQAMSGLSDDLLSTENGIVRVRPKTPVPKVGFCGNTSSLMGNLKELLQGRLQALRGTILRHRALSQLNRASGIRTNFVLRSSYWGGAVRTRRGHLQLADEGLRQRMRREFSANIIESDYTLCVRGAGNYSIRLYEVLSAGRIPIFLNTRCILPFETVINWRKHCVWVEESEIHRIGEIVSDFHRALDNDGFQRLQIANRRLWEEWLEASAFYDHVLAFALASSRSVVSPPPFA